MATSSSSIGQIRILLIGDTATGKCSYVKKITKNIFQNDTRRDKDYDITSTKIKIDENKEIQVQILNIAGSQRGKSQIKNYFQNIHGFIIMFDVSRAETYDNVLGWKDDLNHVIKVDNLPSILLANKCDLEKDEGLNLVMNMMDEYCQFLRFISWWEISNKDDINIQASIQALVHEIIKRQNSLTSTLPIVPTSPNNIVPLVDRQREYKFKILVIGELGTGKSAIVQRYTKNSFTEMYRSTIGSDIAFKKIKYNDDVTVRIHLWDIAGEERFGCMTRLFYKDTAGCLVVFDVSRPSTLIDSVVKWKEDFDKKVTFDDERRIPCLLIGNKCDLMKEGVVSSQTYMENFCRTNNFVRWYETSAKENINIDTSILFLIEKIIENIDPERPIRRSSDIIQITQRPPEIHSKPCCRS